MLETFQTSTSMGATKQSWYISIFCPARKYGTICGIGSSIIKCWNRINCCKCIACHQSTVGKNMYHNFNRVHKVLHFCIGQWLTPIVAFPCFCYSLSHHFNIPFSIHPTYVGKLPRRSIIGQQLVLLSSHIIKTSVPTGKRFTLYWFCKHIANKATDSDGKLFTNTRAIRRLSFATQALSVDFICAQTNFTTI